nr:hypothetical protein [Pseudomonas psychrotolerans]
MKSTSETGDAQAVLDIVATAPMLDSRFIGSREIWMADGEGNTVGVGDQFGPTGKARCAGHQPLCIGQLIVRAGSPKGAQLCPSMLGFVALESFQQPLGLLAQRRQVEKAVVT